MKFSEDSQLLAVDPSLTASGWVLFAIRDPQPRAAGMVFSSGPKIALAQRLTELQEKLELLFDQLQLTVGDILVCEGPAPLVKNPQSALKVEHVRSIFEAIARNRGVIVPGRINPRTVQVELLGMKGKQIARKEVKLWAREIAIRLYGKKLFEVLRADDKKVFKTLPQDVIDAALIGSVAQVRIKLSLDSEVNLIQSFIAEGKISNSRKYNRFASRVKSVVWDELQFARLLAKR